MKIKTRGTLAMFLIRSALNSCYPRTDQFVDKLPISLKYSAFSFHCILWNRNRRGKASKKVGASNIVL